MTALEDLKLPLVKNNICRMVPALSAGWCDQRSILEYRSPPLPEEENENSFVIGAKEDWLDRMGAIKTDLEWLLGLDYHEFWSNMIYREDRMTLVCSFLKNAHPEYMLHEFPNDDKMLEIFNSVHYLILCVLSRLGTVKESEDHFMSMKKYSAIMYEYFIFTVPRLMDICLLYGSKYRNVVTKIIATVLEAQPVLLGEDLDDIIRITLKCMRFIQRQFISSSESDTAKSLDMKDDSHIPFNALKNVCTTILDLFATVHYFMDLCPSVCEHYHRHSFELRLASFYEAVMPKIYDNLEAIMNECTTKQFEDIKNILEEARGFMLRTYRHILSWCLHSAVEAGLEGGRHFADDYTVILTESLCEKYFSTDYHTNFPVHQDLDTLSQVSPEIEESVEYIIEAILTNFDLSKEGKSKFMVAREKAKEDKAEKVAIDTAVLEVKEVLPHLEDAFIQKCLSEYQNNSQRVINAVLENTLPQYLQESCEKDNKTTRYKKRGGKEPGENVLDDELDDELNDDEVLYRRTVHSSMIQCRRKLKHKNLNQMLNDKSDIKELKQKGLFNSLGMTDVYTYEDEYDDTYDSSEVAVDDSQEVERRPIVVPRVLETRKPVEDEVAQADESEEEDKPAEKPRDVFVPNPEEVRARRNVWYGNRRSADVVGRPKGQGQNKDVTRNRDKKNVNKSTRGNHNRRGGAQWKRSQGMIPS